MKTFSWIIALLLASAVSVFPAHAQDAAPEVAKWTFLPPGLNFQPLRANLEEARVGLLKFSNTSEMKLDIGNSIDLFSLEVPKNNLRATLGIDFFGYAMTASEEGFRLQIDALEGYFGGNVEVSEQTDGGLWETRVRIAHHSGHFVDGEWDKKLDSWFNNQQPFAYNRDFGELVLSNTRRIGEFNFRAYGGASWATLMRPAFFQRWQYLGGLEFSSDQLTGNILGKPTVPFVAYNASLEGTPAYSAGNTIQLGVKLGQWNGKGPLLYLEYYAGRQFFTEFYNEQIRTVAAGFMVEFD